MKFFRDLKTDYLESRFSDYESFAEWFLKRKLGFWGSGKELDWSKRVRLPTPAQLKLSGRQFEVGDKANFVRNSRNGQIWSVKHEQSCQSTTALRC
ncbi:hypothetical protein HPA18_06720 [Streptococcus suis]|uniref:hypothetical protein n=1 Tax=Streptococcus suis TaxID=1307 RepID=UPI001557D5B8|nr:hypothetical protein [Streptococcus suis]